MSVFGKLFGIVLIMRIREGTKGVMGETQGGIRQMCVKNIITWKMSFFGGALWSLNHFMIKLIDTGIGEYFEENKPPM